MTALFEKGREGFLGGTIDWDTNTIKCALLDLNTADTGVKQISSSTNASPPVMTVTAHGFSNGDTVFIDGHATNTAANGIWKIANVTANTFELQRPDGVNATGNGVGGATGYAVCLGPSAAGDNLDDFDACVVGTAQTLGSPTIVAGVADAADPTFTAVSGATVEAFAIYKDTGTASTSTMIFINTGKFVVTCNTQAASSATAIPIEPCPCPIPSGTVLVFSNGASATLSGSAAVGDRSLAVTALAAIVAAGARALAPATGSGLPVTPNGGNISIAFDNGANKIFKL